VSIYFHGDWHDLCRGPHLSSTGKIGKFFKLTKVSGAYWRGDSNNEMLKEYTVQVGQLKKIWMNI
jgi:threonyl-tRNA synthetase